MIKKLLEASDGLLRYDHDELVLEKDEDGQAIKVMHMGQCRNDSDTHRYVLWRHWGTRKDVKVDMLGMRHNVAAKTVCYVGVNPSTANYKKNDPTVKNLVRISKRLGYDGFYLVNLYARRGSDASEAIHKRFNEVEVQDGVDVNSKLCEMSGGFVNERFVEAYVRATFQTFLCWGNNASYRDAVHWKHAREKILLQRRAYGVKSFGLTGKGHYKHPLMLEADGVKLEAVS